MIQLHDQFLGTNVRYKCHETKKNTNGRIAGVFNTGGYVYLLIDPCRDGERFVVRNAENCERIVG